MRQTWRIRAMLLAIGVFILAAAYLILIPDLPPAQREWVSNAIPYCVLAGVFVGAVVLLVDRRYPRILRKATPATLAVPMLGLLGVLMAIETNALILLGAGMTGCTLLVATPLVRFTTPTKDSAPDASHPHTG
jgi:membrane protease YdiL (CAAX protease family)